MTVTPPKGFRAGGDTAGPEALRMGDGHGATPNTDSPVVSGSPDMMLAHCTA